MNIARRKFADDLPFGYFVEKGRIRQFTIHMGIRYVNAQPVGVEQALNTIGCCQAKRKARSRGASSVCKHKTRKTKET